ncbi:hypothetical protein D3C80_1149180 [compost metagenome]
MNYDGAMLQAVLSNVGKIKFLRHLEIQLNRSALPASFERIKNMKINLRAIKCPITFVDKIIDTKVVQHALQCLLGLIPQLFRAHGILRSRGELYLIFKAQHLIYMVNQRNNAANLLFNLLR